MGLALLGDILNHWETYPLDDEIYLPIGEEPALEMSVRVLHFDARRSRFFEGYKYLLGIEQVRDAITGLEYQLRRAATPSERLRAVLYYARYDAFIDPG